MNFDPRTYKQGPVGYICRGTLPDDDETTAICPGCGEGFEPGSRFIEYRDEDDCAWFHENCEP